MQRGMMIRIGSAVTLSACLWSPHAVAAGLPTISPARAVARPGPIERGSDAEAEPLVGTPAPALPSLPWLDGVARDSRSLEGRVVVIRTFTNACPFCAATMPTLDRIHREYADRGLVVLGVYHPKPPRPTAATDVATLAGSLGITFPVAIDTEWRLVDGWWLARVESAWTSITWVLDRRGTIRYVHPGGEYHDGGGPAHARCRRDARALRRVIDELLAEPGAASSR